VHEEAVLGKYTVKCKSNKEEPFHPLSESQLTSSEYALSFLAKNGSISVDPHWVNTSTARGLDEAITEDEENSYFVTDGTRVKIVATYNIVPGDQLLIRYAYEYWMNSKWLLDQLSKIYDKFRHTKPKGLTIEKWLQICQDWQLLILQKRAEKRK
jgi:hypothetical protein